MLTKTRPVTVKAGPDDDAGLAEGQFEAMVSVFGNVDSDGDRVVKGAFEKSLAERAERGDPLPVVWTHDHRNAFSYVGRVLDAHETDEGLYVKGQLDIDPARVPENRDAQQVYQLLKDRLVTKWSYAYDVKDEQPVDDANELLELALHEVGPTLVGSNYDTDTLGVKSRKKDNEDEDETKQVSDKPWTDFPDSAFDDEQYAAACLLDRGEDAGTAKQRYSLPVREPDGTVNRNACHAAAAALAGGRGGVDATDEQKRAAARKLVALYRSELDEDPPDALAELGKSHIVALNALLDEDPQLVEHLKSFLVGVKRGRTLSAKNEQKIRDAVTALEDVLASLGEPDQEKASNATDQEPNKATSQEPRLARALAVQKQLTLKGGST